MEFINSVTKIPTFMMKITSSIFSSGANYICGSAGMNNLIDAIFNFISKLYYFISKWMLFILDLLFSFVRQLCGLEMNYESIETLVSKDSDFVFNLLFSATETITPIIRNLIGLAVVLILFFAMLAVIKTAFESGKTKSPADIRGVIAKTIRAFILLIITPMLAIIGIVASNTILKSLYNATNTTNSNTLSSQIFLASAQSANAYRTYAQRGLKIPITFDFTKQMEILEYYKNKPVTDEFRKYVNSVENIIFTNYKNFYAGEFTEFDSLNDTYSSTGAAAERAQTYYNYYDRSSEAFKAGGSAEGINKYKKILAYRPEYFVMADVIEYCIASGNKTYFKTIEEMLDSVVDIGDDGLFNNIINMYGIKFINNDLQEYVLGSVTNPVTQVSSTKASLRDIYLSEPWKVIRFESTYYDVDDASNPLRKMDIQYNHVRGETDEINGAKYIMCVENDYVRSFVTDAVNTPYFYPLTNGYSLGSDTVFETDYIQRNQIIIAKGVFSESTYPTAIRQSEDGAEVQFYRHKLTTVTIGDSGNVIQGEIKAEEEKGIKKLFKLIASLFNPKIDLSINHDEVITAYTYEEVIVNNLASGTLRISYMFEDWISNFLGGIASGPAKVISSATGAEGAEQIGLFGLKLTDLFIPRKLNLILLIMAPMILLKIVFAAVFELINRAYELFLTIMIYPTACATIPLDDSGYKEWTKTYVGRLFSTYGLVLGLNFVLMLFPIISKLEIFTANEIAQSAPLMRFRNLFTLGFLPAISLEFLASFLNLVCVIIFQLVAFTLLETLPQTISQIVGGDSSKSINPIENISKALSAAGGVAKTVFSGGAAILSGAKDILGAISPSQKARDRARDRIKQKARDKMDKVKKQAMKFVPGSEIVGAAKDRANLMKKKKAQKDAEKELKESMFGAKMVQDEKDPSKKRAMTTEERTKDVQETFNKMIDAQDQYSKALKDPRGNREAEDEKRRQEKKSGLDESSRGDDEDMVYDENGNETGEAADVSHKSKRKLKKAKKRQKAIIKRLERKERMGTISDEERLSLDRQKKKLAKTQEAFEERKTYRNAKFGIKSNILRIKEKRGTLSKAEQDELNMYRAQQKSFKANHSRKKVKQTEKDRKNEAKARVKQRKELAKAEKIAEKEKDIKRKFTTGSKLSQEMFLAKNEFTQNRMKKKLEKKGVDLNNVDMNSLSFMQKRQLKKYQQASSKLQTAVDTISTVSETKAIYDAQRKAQYDMVRHRNKASTKRGDRLLKRFESGADERNLELEKIRKALSSIENSENGVDASNVRQYRDLQKRKAELEAKNRFQQRWDKQNAKDKKTLRQEARDYRYQEKLDVYNFETKQHDKSEAEIEKEARKRLKAKGKYNPTDPEVKQEMKAIKNERKSSGKKESEEK